MYRVYQIECVPPLAYNVQMYLVVGAGVVLMVINLGYVISIDLIITV